MQGSHSGEKFPICCKRPTAAAADDVDGCISVNIAVAVLIPCLCWGQTKQITRLLRIGYNTMPVSHEPPLAVADTNGVKLELFI